FAKPVVILLVLEWVIITGAVALARPFTSGEKAVIPTITALCLLLLATDLYAAAEFGMWVGLSSKKTTQALTKTMLYLLILPTLSIACCFWPLALIKNIILINYVRDQLRRRFRIVAAEQFAGGASDAGFFAKPPSSCKLPSVLPPRIPPLP